MRVSPFVLVLVAGGCGGAGGAADSPSGDPGGNVGFGGAQDIGEFRGILERGEIPGPDTLDANGFFNEHFVEPPPVTCDGPLCLTPGLSVGRDFLTGSYQAALQISVNTTIDPAQHPRLPMRLAVVVDHSGSMAEDGRLDKVKVGLHALIDNLQDDDRLALLEFDDDVAIDAPFGATLDRASLHAKVDLMRPDGGTNIFDGLKAGLDILGTPEIARQNRVIFLSDGLATVGNTSQDAIIEMATPYISKGIGLTTIGVGNDFDVNLMRGLAERGAGNFYFVEDATAATEVFTEEVDVFMEPIALDLQIDAVTPTDWTMKEVAGTNLWQPGAHQASMQVPAVFFASRTSQQGEVGRRGGGSMIFIHLDTTANTAGEVATVTLSYRLPGSQERITHVVDLNYDRNPQETPETPFLSYPTMAERYAMYNMYLGFKLAAELSQTDYNCAASVLSAMTSSAEVWNSTHDNDPDITADIDLAHTFIANLRTKGATGDQTLASCPSAQDPYPVDQPGYGDEVYQGPMACSSGKANAGWLLILGAFMFIRRRRR